MDFGAIRTPARSQNCQRPTSASQQRKTPVSSIRVTFEPTANRFFSPSKRQALTAAARSQEQLYGTINEMPERLSSISHAMRLETAHGIRQKPISEETRTSEFYQRRTVTPHKLKKKHRKNLHRNLHGVDYSPNDDAMMHFYQKTLHVGTL